MISNTSKRAVLPPKVYQQGFQEAILEFEHFEQVKKRLNQIKAFQQLKKGEHFLEQIEAA